MLTESVVSSRAHGSLVFAGRVLAVAGACIGVVLYLFVMSSEFGEPWKQVAVCVWVAVPIPIGWWLGQNISRSTTALGILVVGLALLWALGVWLYWDAFLGPSSRTESLAGLIVLFAPFYQFVGLAVTLLLAWAINRWGRPGGTKP